MESGSRYRSPNAAVEEFAAQYSGNKDEKVALNEALRVAVGCLEDIETAIEKERKIFSAETNQREEDHAKEVGALREACSAKLKSKDDVHAAERTQVQEACDARMRSYKARLEKLQRESVEEATCEAKVQDAVDAEAEAFQEKFEKLERERIRERATCDQEKSDARADADAAKKRAREWEDHLTKQVNIVGNEKKKMERQLEQERRERAKTDATLKDINEALDATLAKLKATQKARAEDAKEIESLGASILDLQKRVEDETETYESTINSSTKSWTIRRSSVINIAFERSSLQWAKVRDEYVKPAMRAAAERAGPALQAARTSLGDSFASALDSLEVEARWLAALDAGERLRRSAVDALQENFPQHAPHAPNIVDAAICFVATLIFAAIGAIMARRRSHRAHPILVLRLPAPTQ